MHPLPGYKALPHALRVLFWVFLILPLWSLSFLPPPWTVADSGHWWLAALNILTYWVFPLATCAAIIGRSFLFLPIFPAQILLLAIHALVNWNEDRVMLDVLRVVLLGFTLVISCLFASRDFLFPFLSRGSRFWRSSPRVQANTRLKIAVAADPSLHSIVMEDCSSTGMAVSGSKDGLGVALVEAGPDAPLKVIARIGPASLEIAATQVWSTESGEMVRVGLHTADAKAMSALMASLPAARNGGRTALLARTLWARSSTRRALLTVWATAIGGSVGMPACGTQHAAHVNLRTRAGNVGHGFALSDPRDPQPRPDISQSYTGRGLEVNCDGGAPTKLSDSYSQDQLLHIYSGDHGDWLRTAMESLQESDANGTLRPRKPVHPDLWRRLNALQLGFWELSHVRFRFNGTYAIKIGYAANLGVGAPDPALRSIDFIHGIAIPDTRKAEFVADVESIPQDETRSGCRIKELLDKWLPASSYWFLHTEIQDLLPVGPIQWVYTESLVFKGDDKAIATGCQDWFCDAQASQFFSSGGSNQGTALGLLNQRRDDKTFEHNAMTDGCFNPTRPTLRRKAADCAKTARTWVGIHGSPANAADAGKKTLRLSPMSFPEYVYDEQTDVARALGEEKDLDLWFSGDVTNATLARAHRADDSLLHPSSPAFANDSILTCVGCHIRQTTTPTADPGRPLAPAVNMDFRMVGFGFKAPFGTPRWPMVSPFLRATAMPNDGSGYVSYELMGARADAVGRCDPFGGCTGCRDGLFAGVAGPLAARNCYYDAAWMARFHTADKPLALQFESIASESLKQAKACVAAEAAGQIGEGQCEALRCIALRAGSDYPLMQKLAGTDREEADPTFGCEMDLSVRRGE